MRRNPSTDTSADFSEKRKIFKNIASSKYYEYLKKLADDLKTNPKRFWTFLKSLGKHSSMVIQLRDDTGNLISDDAEKAEILSKAFASKFVNSAVNGLPRVPAYPLDTLPRLSVTESAVRSALLQLNPTKACGPDNFSAKIILECADQLVSPLTKILSKSVETDVFSNMWKEANIIPILKKVIERTRSTIGLLASYLSLAKYWRKSFMTSCTGTFVGTLSGTARLHTPQVVRQQSGRVSVLGVGGHAGGIPDGRYLYRFFFGFPECEPCSIRPQIAKFSSSQRLCTTMVRLVSLRQASESRGERKDLSMDRSHFRCARRLTFGSSGFCSLYQ